MALNPFQNTHQRGHNRLGFKCASGFLVSFHNGEMTHA